MIDATSFELSTAMQDWNQYEAKKEGSIFLAAHIKVSDDCSTAVISLI